MEAEIFLYNAESGRLLFRGDGKPLTGIRTAAVSAAASLRLRPELSSLRVFGAGVQAAAHIAALASAHPSLTELDNGAPQFHTDFRRIYATVLEPWLGFDSKEILGGQFEPLDVLDI
ncbi:MAG: hypothetical protein IIB89_07350 [Chloroflexi bacterium]|nr:hypothetical protein [Chloroflexota bacterium]